MVRHYNCLNIFHHKSSNLYLYLDTLNFSPKSLNKASYLIRKRSTWLVIRKNYGFMSKTVYIVATKTIIWNCQQIWWIIQSNFNKDSQNHHYIIVFFRESFYFLSHSPCVLILIQKGRDSIFASETDLSQRGFHQGKAKVHLWEVRLATKSSFSSENASSNGRFVPRLLWSNLWGHPLRKPLWHTRCCADVVYKIYL